MSAQRQNNHFNNANPHSHAFNQDHDQRQPFFATNVHFAWCPTELVKEFCGDGPSVPQDGKSKKRASGLDLLRPKSSKGQNRDFGASCPPVLSPTLISHTLPPRDWSTSTHPLSPQLSPDSGRGSLRAPIQSKHNKASSWEIIEEIDDFPRSVKSGTKIPLTRSHGSSPPGGFSGEWGMGQEGSMQWVFGIVQLELGGYGGQNGGELSVQSRGSSCRIITHIIPPMTIKSGPRRPSRLTKPAWDTSDIQLIHPSVLSRPHVMSLRLRGIPNSTPSTIGKKSNSNPRESRPKTSTGISGVFGLRARGQTFSGRGSLDVNRADPTSPVTGTLNVPLGSPQEVRSFGSALDSVMTTEEEGRNDRTIFLCFSSAHELDDWYTILRSLAGNRTNNKPRSYRRLALTVLDLTEVRHPNRGASTDPKTPSEHDRLSRYSDGGTRATSGQESGSVSSRKGKELKSGWVRKDRLCMELRIDDIVRARTTWMRASKTGIPFWGEAFGLTDLPSFSTCVLVIYRQSKGKAVMVAIVDLSLVSDISSAKDERYAVKAITDGSVVGELRLAVSYQDISLLSKDRYAVSRLVYPDNVDALYALDQSHSLDGAFDTLAKIGVASGHVYSLIAEMIGREGKGADSTLFRGNTPLSKLFEATLRLMSDDFLKRSIGPTVARIAKDVWTGSLIAPTGEPFHDEVRRVSDQIQACWADLYAARGSLVEYIAWLMFYHKLTDSPLKTVLGTLYWAVREAHGQSKERHFPYKAISSFLFLRLINPALIRPHLFGLRSGLYSPGAQKTATLIARVLSAMAFFSPRDAQRDRELALFSDIISSNYEMMLDYLGAFGVDPQSHPQRTCGNPVGESFRFVASRIGITPRIQADAIPIPSLAGAIDVQAELGVLSAVVAHRRDICLSQEDDAEFLRVDKKGAFMDELDRNLRDVLKASSGNAEEQMDDEDPETPIDNASRPPFTMLDPAFIPFRDAGPEITPSTPWLEQDNDYTPQSRSSSPLPSRSSSPFSSQGPFSRVLEQAQRAQHATGAMMRRSLSSKRIARRGSMSRLEIQIAGREADDPGRPKTARR